MTDKQLQTIGEYVCTEITRNRPFRRQVEKLPLGMHILYVIDHPEQFEQSKKQSRFKRFMNRMRTIFSNEHTLYGGGERKSMVEVKK